MSLSGMGAIASTGGYNPQALGAGAAGAYHPSQHSGDRFIAAPRSSMAMEVVNWKLTSDGIEEGQNDPAQRHRADRLAQALFGISASELNKTSIVGIVNRAPVRPVDRVLNAKTCSVIARRQLPKPAVKISEASVLDAPDALSDYYTHLFDFSQSGHLAILLGNSLNVKNHGESGVRVWQLASETIDILPTAVRFVGDDSVIIGSNSGVICIFDRVGEGSIAKVLEMPSPITEICPIGPHHFLIGTYDSRLILAQWDATEIKIIESWQMESNRICAIELKPVASNKQSSQTVAVGFNKNLVKIVRISRTDGQYKCRVVAEYKEHVAAVRAIAWRPGGGQLATGGGRADKKIRIWTYHVDGSTSTSVEINFSDYVSQVCWTPDGKQLLAAGGWQSNVNMYRVDPSGEMVSQRYYSGTIGDGRSLGARYNPVTKQVATLAGECLYFWNFEAEKVQERVPERRSRLNALTIR